MDIIKQQELLMAKKVEEFISRGGVIEKVKYRGPKEGDAQTINTKKKKKVKGKYAR